MQKFRYRKPSPQVYPCSDGEETEVKRSASQEQRARPRESATYNGQFVGVSTPFQKPAEFQKKTRSTTPKLTRRSFQGPGLKKSFGFEAMNDELPSFGVKKQASFRKEALKTPQETQDQKERKDYLSRIGIQADGKRSN